MGNLSILPVDVSPISAILPCHEVGTSVSRSDFIFVILSEEPCLYTCAGQRFFDGIKQITGDDFFLLKLSRLDYLFNPAHV